MASTNDTRPHFMDLYTMRMLGDNLTLSRIQWEELHDLISSMTHDGQAQRARIRALLASDARRAA